MVKPVAIFVGFLGELPLAGMALANIHFILGLQDLGYDVHYVECTNKPDQCYNPETNEMTDDPSYALQYMHDLLPKYGVKPDRFSFISRDGACHGSGWKSLKAALSSADFLINMGNATWFDELGLCRNRAFIDVDPMFTQLNMLNESTGKTEILNNYDTLFTYGVRMGEADCTIPDAGRTWIPARMGIANRIWHPNYKNPNGPITTLMNWSSGSELTHEGKAYGYKDKEFEAYMDVPTKSSKNWAIAVGGNAPRDKLQQFGWEILNPLRISKTVSAYAEFIANSYADFGIVKQAYIVSKGGWFSDRSTCYMASGRPGPHQDTGFGEWLPTGEGVFSFSNEEELLEAIHLIESDYEKHARAARLLSEKYFEASDVIREMLAKANFQ